MNKNKTYVQYMKVWIVGPQGTCKKELTNLFTDDKFGVAKLFTSQSQSNDFYRKYLYNFYDGDTVGKMYENTAYIFMNDVPKSVGVYEGLEFNEYDNNDIIILSPNQFCTINTKYINKGDLVVWLDGTYNWRKLNIDDDYDNESQESIERSCYINTASLMNSLRTSMKNVLYFYEEVPERVKTIVKVIYNNPKLKDEFVKNFNPTI